MCPCAFPGILDVPRMENSLCKDFYHDTAFSNWLCYLKKMYIFVWFAMERKSSHYTFRHNFSPSLSLHTLCLFCLFLVLILVLLVSVFFLLSLSLSLFLSVFTSFFFFFFLFGVGVGRSMGGIISTWSISCVIDDWFIFVIYIHSIVNASCFAFSSDIIPSGWLGSKHQLTNKNCVNYMHCLTLHLKSLTVSIHYFFFCLKTEIACSIKLFSHICFYPTMH